MSTLVARGLLILAALGAALDGWVLLRKRPNVPEAELSLAKAALAKERKPGDVVVVSPLFSMRELSALGEGFVSPAIPSAETFASRRILLLDRRDVRTHLEATPTRVVPIGETLSLSTYEPTGAGTTLVFDLYSDLDRARMSIVRGENEVVCSRPRTEGGLGCSPEPEWLYMARRSLDIEGRSVSCVWAHPTTNGIVRIELPATPSPPPGRKLVLELEGALTDDAATTPDGAPVNAAVTQAGQPAGAMSVPNARGIRRASIVIKGDTPTRIEITTVRDGRRHFCLNARIGEAKE